MIEINQDVLCAFCKNINDSNMSMCEGSECERMTDLYLEDKGITEDDPTIKTFGKLNVGDEIYILFLAKSIPEIKKYEVASISKISNDCLRVEYNEHNYIDIQFDKTELNSLNDCFLYKKDCQKKLEEICTSRIIELSKVIGSLD